MSLYTNIRGALQSRAILAAGFPPANQRAFEGVLFDSAVGTPWARLMLMPQVGRAFAVNAITKQHSGLFQVDIFYPPNQGTGAAEIVADAVKAMFNPGTRLTQGGETVIIDYAERAAALLEPDWVHIPLTVGWRAFSTNN